MRYPMASGLLALLLVACGSGGGSDSSGGSGTTAQPPTAQDDTYATPKNVAKSLTPLANDSDPNGDTLTLVSVAAASHGTAVKNGNNVTYTPTNGYTGTDSFTYKMTDGSDNATATITVTIANSAPSAQNDNATTPQDTAKTLSPLANDSDANGDTLTLLSVATASHGTTAKSGNDVTSTPANGYTGTDSFTYKVTDGSDNATATISITVSAGINAPTVVNDQVTLSKNTTLVISPLANDSDADGDNLTLGALGSAGQGRVVDLGNGSVAYTPSTDFIGSDSFTYKASDGSNETQGTVSLTVSAARVGYLHPGPVSGVAYAANSHSGTTGGDSAFLYQPGETIAFSIGSVTLGSSKGNRYLNPVNLVDNATDSDNQTVRNIARFLYSLDDDNKTGNGIQISQNTINAATTVVDFTKASFQADYDGYVQALTAGTQAGARGLADEAAAVTHLKFFFRGYDYLNRLRAQAGMTDFGNTPNASLELATEKHTRYLVSNNVTGHYETSGNPDFYGVAPADRTGTAGFLSTKVGEVGASNDPTAFGSLDGLMSAIYHRFGILDPRWDLAGAAFAFKPSNVQQGVESTYFVNFGNSALNTLCSGTSFNGFGTIVTGGCVDGTFRIEQSVYSAAEDGLAQRNPRYVLWPTDNATGVMPVFYEESPDPLPDLGVSGYPVGRSAGVLHTASSLASGLSLRSRCPPRTPGSPVWDPGAGGAAFTKGDLKQVMRW